MSAPSIPNLLSLRGSARGGRGRGRGRHPGGPPSSSARPGGAQAQDAVVQGTDNDAAVSRLSAVELGYLDDPYARYFVQRGFGLEAPRRLPIINRGTYTRTTALDRLIDQFLGDDDDAPTQQGTPRERQIVSLGAGTDTRSLRIFSRRRRGGSRLTYHEIDFPAICKRKVTTVSTQAPLRQVLGTPTEEKAGVSWRCRVVAARGGGGQEEGSGEDSQEWWCHGVDLRDLAKTRGGDSDGSSAFEMAGLRTDVPTLLLSECCLCYLEGGEAGGVVGFFADRIPNLGIVVYEPIRPDDAFGKMMVSNLAARGIRMPTLALYREPADQEERLRRAGFEQVRHMTVEQIWERWVAEEEKERVDGLERLDEVEEWKLLAGHYIVAWGWRGAGFAAWQEEPAS